MKGIASSARHPSPKQRQPIAIIMNMTLADNCATGDRGSARQKTTSTTTTSTTTTTCTPSWPGGRPAATPPTTTQTRGPIAGRLSPKRCVYRREGDTSPQTRPGSQKKHEQCGGGRPRPIRGPRPAAAPFRASTRPPARSLENPGRCKRGWPESKRNGPCGADGKHHVSFEADPRPPLY
jgi:hypothetical protein